MKQTFTILFFLLLVVTARSQGVSDYYRPAQGSRLSPDALYSEGQVRPNRNVSWDRIMARYGEAYTKSRWHVGVEGLVRTDRSRLDQTFNGLVNTESATALNWGVTVGWVSRERWAIEGGYSHMPIHNTLLVGSGSSPLRFEFENPGHAFVLRGKRRLAFNSKSSEPVVGVRAGNRSGFWIGAGMWAIPGSAKAANQMSFRGYVPRGPRANPDTIRLLTETRSSNNLTVLAELSTEYAIRLGGRSEMGIFLRKSWGFSSAISTNLDYRISRGEPQHGVIRSNGSGWSFGIVFRYVHGHTYDVSKMPRIFNLKGNQSEGKTESKRIGEAVYEP